jgi:hypothetical protein
MGSKQHKPAGIVELVAGIVALFAAIIACVVFFGPMIFSGGDWVVPSNGFVVLFGVIICLIIVGYLGGILLGRYIEAQRAKKYRPPPPP